MPKAPSRKKTEKAESPSSVITLAKVGGSNLLTPMNFRVSAQFHLEFKLYAVKNGISMVNLLQEAFELLKTTRGR